MKKKVKYRCVHNRTLLMPDPLFCTCAIFRMAVNQNGHKLTRQNASIVGMTIYIEKYVLKQKISLQKGKHCLTKSK